VDDHDGFAQLLHAAHHMGSAWRAPIPEGEEHIACLSELLVAPRPCGLPEALPIRYEAARADVVLDGPAKAEPIGPAGAAVQHLRHQMFVQAEECDRS
jgi:hypothetical protein